MLAYPLPAVLAADVLLAPVSGQPKLATADGAALFDEILEQALTATPLAPFVHPQLPTGVFQGQAHPPKTGDSARVVGEAPQAGPSFAAGQVCPAPEVGHSDLAGAAKSGEGMPGPLLPPNGDAAIARALSGGARPSDPPNAAASDQTVQVPAFGLPRQERSLAGETARCAAASSFFSVPSLDWENSASAEEKDRRQKTLDSLPEAPWAESTLSTEAAPSRHVAERFSLAGVESEANPADQIKEAVLPHRAEAHSNKSEIHLRLTPPELGGVRLHLTGDDHTLTARLVVEREDTQLLLEHRAQHLRQRIEEAGITVARLEIAWQGNERSDARREPPPRFDSPCDAQPWPPAKPKREPDRARGLVDFLA